MQVLSSWLRAIRIRFLLASVIAVSNGLAIAYWKYAIIDSAALYVGLIVGILSATVLFVNSFPDYEADKSKGRRTLVIILGKRTASAVFPVFVVATYALISVGIFLGYTQIYSLISFGSIPLS